VEYLGQPGEFSHFIPLPLVIQRWFTFLHSLRYPLTSRTPVNFAIPEISEPLCCGGVYEHRRKARVLYQDLAIQLLISSAATRKIRRAQKAGELGQVRWQHRSEGPAWLPEWAQGCVHVPERLLRTRLFPGEA
jgi:hypothetical protein